MVRGKGNDENGQNFNFIYRVTLASYEAKGASYEAKGASYEATLPSYGANVTFMAAVSYRLRTCLKSCFFEQ